MLDFSHIPTGTGSANVQIFTGTSPLQGTDWQTWLKPRGKTMIDIFLVGAGGQGGQGGVGAAGSAGGGGGGGSGAQVRLRMPLFLLPDVLYLTLVGDTNQTNQNSYISIAPRLLAGAGVPIANNTLMYATNGSWGSTGTTTGGAGGTGGAISTVSNMPLGWQYASALAGITALAGGNTGTPTAVTLPVTGVLVTPGAPGAGLPASGAGASGGAFTAAGRFPAHPGGAGGSTTTTPPLDGCGGYQPIPNLGYWYGGSGGGSTNAAATGAGLHASIGGNGAPGCGGGGGGGALTGTTAAARGGVGGPALAIITCW